MHFQGAILGIIPKRLQRISSFDLDSEPEKTKLRKQSNWELVNANLGGGGGDQLKNSKKEVWSQWNLNPSRGLSRF